MWSKKAKSTCGLPGPFIDFVNNWFQGMKVATSLLRVSLDVGESGRNPHSSLSHVDDKGPPIHIANAEELHFLIPI